MTDIGKLSRWGLDNAALADILRQPTQEVLQRMTGVVFNEQNAPPLDRGVAIQFAISGTLNGQLAIIMEWNLSQMLARRMLATMGLPDDPGDYWPALGELGNMIMGHIDGKLYESGLDCTFAQPTVSDVHIRLPEETTPALTVALGSTEGAMELDLYLIPEKRG